MSAGFTLEQAALASGISVDECIDYVKEKKNDLDYELKVAGQEALKNALTKLTELSTGGVREGKDFQSTDLIAATELAKVAIAAIKISQSAKKPEKKDGERDLFDVSVNINGPWNLKKIE